MGDIGVDHDRVSLTLNGEVVLIAESYEIQQSILTQPCAFAMRLGYGDKIKDLINKYPAGTPFQLSIDGAVQFSGKTDGFSVEGSAGASEFTLRGRDSMAPLHDAMVRSEKSFSDITYSELVEQVFALAMPGQPFVLLYSNEKNRKAVARIGGAKSGGGSVKASGSGETLAEKVIGALVVGPGSTFAKSLVANGQTTVEQLVTTGVLKDPSQQARTLQAKIGEGWFGFLKKELDRAGLLLWSTASGDFVLSTPDTTQPPSYRIFRKRGSTRNMVDVKTAAYSFDTTRRYSECIVHFRRGGGKEPRGRGFGVHQDAEMLALGFNKPLCVKDDRCKTLAQADQLARQKISEARRSAWQLQYTVAGHTTESLAGGRAIWTQDTTVEVDDDELGIKGVFYIESVGKTRRPETTSTLNLMRLEDAELLATERSE